MGWGVDFIVRGEVGLVDRLSGGDSGSGEDSGSGGFSRESHH